MAEDADTVPDMVTEFGYVTDDDELEMDMAVLTIVVLEVVEVEVVDVVVEVEVETEVVNDAENQTTSRKLHVA